MTKLNSACKRNTAPARSKRTVVERGYFHTGNSGISISMIESTENYDWDEKDRDWYNHNLEIRHSAFGAGSSFSTPIAGPTMCDYYIEAFTRLRNRMLNDPNYRLPTVFGRYPYPGSVPEFSFSKGNDNYRIVDIQEGLTREEVWSEEIIVSEYSSETRLLGHNFLNEEGKVVRFEPYEGRVVRGGDSSSPQFKTEDIGKPVKEVENAGPQYDEESSE